MLELSFVASLAPHFNCFVFTFFLLWSIVSPSKLEIELELLLATILLLKPFDAKSVSKFFLLGCHELCLFFLFGLRKLTVLCPITSSCECSLRLFLANLGGIVSSLEILLLYPTELACFVGDFGVLGWLSGEPTSVKSGYICLEAVPKLSNVLKFGTLKVPYLWLGNPLKN